MATIRGGAEGSAGASSASGSGGEHVGRMGIRRSRPKIKAQGRLIGMWRVLLSRS
jgi:hypothetical protein